MINVLADQYLYKIQQYLPDNINLSLFDPAEGFPEELEKSHGLLVRTVIPINSDTLSPVPKQLKFVGTASAGSDHVDIEFLNRNGISFTDAAGCNARSVAEYVTTALLLWTEKYSFDLTQLKVGIIGVGNAGSQVKKMLSQLDVSTVSYDPPKAEREPEFVSASLPELLDCEVLTFHTPLTKAGNHPTAHWLDKEKLSNHRFKLIINSARGGIIDEQVLLRAMEADRIEQLIIDTWEDEPEFRLQTAAKAFIKTPHIAGYSVQAKKNASRIAAHALLDHFDIAKPRKEHNQTPRVLDTDISTFDGISSLLEELHPIKKYELELQNIIENNPEERGIRFNKLRSEYPLRQEFAQTLLPQAYFEQFPILKPLGFSLMNSDSK